jgi:gamma-F420-2:alpha-L-glutamate ligase
MAIWILSKNTEKEYENRRLLEEFSNAGVEAKLVRPDNFDIVVKGNGPRSILYGNEHTDLPDGVLTRTGSGSNYFCLALIRQLERANVPCINGSDAIELVKDKLYTSQVLAQHNVAIPKTMLMRFPVDVAMVREEIGFPCVVKVLTGSYGKGVYLCQDEKFFGGLMELINSLDSEKTMIIQQFIDKAPGSDLRVWVVGGKVIGAMKRTSANGDFRANITNGGSGEPFEVTPEIDFIARETAKVLGLDIAGVDLLFDETGFKVCEANSAPGFSGFEKYCGVNIASQIVEYIAFKMQPK